MKSGSHRFKKSFTLIEMVVVLFITITMSTIAVLGLRSGSAQGALIRSTARVVLNIRRAQNLALTALVVENPPGSGLYQAVSGFGVYFNITTPERYILFADLDNNKLYTPGTDPIVEEIKLEESVLIRGFTNSPSFSVVFKSPEPTTCINGNCTNTPTNNATIVFGLISDPAVTRQVFINSFGLVEQL